MSIRSRFEGAKARYNSTDFAQKRAENKANAEADYQENRNNAENGVDRPLDELQTSAYEVFGEHKQKLFRDHALRATDRIVGKLTRGNIGGDYTNYTDALGKRIDRAEKRTDAYVEANGIERRKVMNRREKYRQYRSLANQNKIARLEDKAAGAKYEWQRRAYRSDIEQAKRIKGIHDHYGAGHNAKRNKKPDDLRENLDRLTKKRVDAMYRKVLREDHNKNGRTSYERQKFEATMSKKQKRELIREAILRLRKENIAAGRLDASYTVDTTKKMRRPMGDLGKHYEYTHDTPS